MLEAHRNCINQYGSEEIRPDGSECEHGRRDRGKQQDVSRRAESLRADVVFIDLFVDVVFKCS